MVAPTASHEDAREFEPVLCRFAICVILFEFYHEPVGQGKHSEE